MKGMRGLAAGLGVAAFLVIGAACGDANDEPTASVDVDAPPAADLSGTSVAPPAPAPAVMGMMAPDLRLTFEGVRYAGVEILSAASPTGPIVCCGTPINMDDMAVVGTGTGHNPDGDASLEVYQPKAVATTDVYTFHPAQTVEVSKEPGATGTGRATWTRWTAEVIPPAPTALPEAPVPMGLGDVRLPEDADSIVSLFNRLPRDLAGRERATRMDEAGPSRFTAAYGQLPGDGCSSVRLQAEDLSSGEFFPADWTADRFVTWWGLGADWDVQDLGRDGDLFWVRWSTTCRSAPASRALQSAPSPQSYPVSSLTWGKAGSRWVFSIVAGSSEDLAELAAAFVVAPE